MGKACFSRENTTTKMIRVATGLSTAHAAPRTACLYCTRKSRSASVYMISRCAHRVLSDPMSGTLCTYKMSAGGSAGIDARSVTISGTLLSG